MENKILIHSIYKTSEDVISKDIEGISMLVPVVLGVGDLNDEIFQLNETGSEIWKMLDGKTPLENIVRKLSNEYDASTQTIEKGVLDLVRILLEKQFIYEVS